MSRRCLARRNGFALPAMLMVLTVSGLVCGVALQYAHESLRAARSSAELTQAVAAAESALALALQQFPRRDGSGGAPPPSGGVWTGPRPGGFVARVESRPLGVSSFFLLATAEKIGREGRLAARAHAGMVIQESARAGEIGAIPASSTSSYEVVSRGWIRP